MDRSALRLVAVAIFVSFGCTFPYSYPNISINPSISVFQRYLNNCYIERYGHSIDATDYSLLWSIIACSSLIGSILGCVFVPYLANSWGRVATIAFGPTVPQIIGTIIQLVAIRWYLYELLAIGRIIAGLSTGIGLAIQSIYLVECSPSTWRGRIGAIKTIMIAWQSVISIVLGLQWLLGKYTNIYYLVGAPIVPAVILMSGYFFLPESPHFALLILKNPDKALQTLKLLHPNDVDGEKILKTIESQQGTRSSVFSKKSWQTIFGKYRWNLAVGVVASASAAFSGVGGLSRFSTEWFIRTGIESKAAQLSSLGVFIVASVIPSLAAPLLDKIGRRPMFLGSMLACWLCSACFVIFSELSNYKHYNWAGYCAVAAIVAFVIAFGFGQGTVGLFLVSEITPFAYRATADMLATWCMLAATLISNFGVFPLSYKIGLFSYAVLFMLPHAACMIFLWWKTPETCGKEIADVVEKLASKSTNKVADIAA